MKTTNSLRRTRTERRPLPPLALLTALALPLAGCNVDSLLEVDDTGIVTPETARDPANLPGLRVGALGDFMVAYAGNTLGGGGTEGIVLSSGLLGDELYVSDTFGTRQQVDQRNIGLENAGMTDVFRNLHRARRAAEVAAEAYTAALAVDHERYSAAAHAEVTSFAAFAYTIFAQTYCSGVPFSRVADDGSLEHGGPLSTQQMFDRALAGFQEARGLSTAAAQVSLARIGEARTLLSLGRFADAAAAAAAVPTSFVYRLEYSENTPRQNNGVWGITHNRRGYGVAHLEGGNGLPFRQGNSQSRATQDPRVPYSRNNQRAIDSPYAHFWQQKYPERGSAMPFATGIEARLIEAEAALAQGQSNAYLPILNALRADATALLTGMGFTPPAGGFPALAPLTDPGTAAGRVNQLFQERGFWLFLTGQRLSDMRRLIRQYGRNSETVFPTGTYRRLLFAPVSGSGSLPDDQLEFRPFNFTYGTDVNFPIPFDELNNPNFDQCLNRDA